VVFHDFVGLHTRVNRWSDSEAAALARPEVAESETASSPTESP